MQFSKHKSPFDPRFTNLKLPNANGCLKWLIFLTSAVLIFFSIEKGQSWGGDFALYIRQAKSLLEGTVQECLASNAWSMANSDYKISPDLYPWGFPLLLLPICYFSGIDLFAMKLLEIIFFYLSILVIYLLLRDKLDHVSRLLVVSVFAFNPFLIKFTNNILSDLPGLFFCLVSIFLMEKTIVEKKYLINRSFSLIFIGFSIWFAHLLRPNYILLVPTLFFAQIVEKKTSGLDFMDYLIKNKTAVLPYAVFIIFTFFSGKTLPKGGSYGFYAEFISHINLDYLTGNIYYMAMLPSKFFGGGHTVERGIYLLTLPFTIKGIRLTWKKDYIYFIFFVFTAAFFALWPGRQGLRYIFPLLPFYMYFFMIGLKDFQAKRKASKIDLPRTCFYFLVAFFLIQTGFSAYKNMRNGRQTAEGPYTTESVEMFQFIKENTGKEKTIAFFKPRVMTLLTERHAFMTKAASNLASKGDYVVINKKVDYDQISIGDDEFKKIIHRGFFTQVFENNGFIIYRINRTS